MLVLGISGSRTKAGYLVTVAAIIIAFVTDILDGWFARRWQMANERGYVLDAMGDRAMHLALTLLFLVRYGFHPLFAWLVIFRDIGIYAVRVLSLGWYQKSLSLRWISVVHAGGLRLWLGLFVVREGLQTFDRTDPFGTAAFAYAQYTVLIGSLTLAYYGIYRSLSWLAEESVEGTSGRGHM